MQERRMSASVVLKIMAILTFVPLAHLFKHPAWINSRVIPFSNEGIQQNLQDMTRIYATTSNKQAVTGANNEEFYAQMIDFESEDYEDEDLDDGDNVKFIEGNPRSPKEINE